MIKHLGKYSLNLCEKRFLPHNIYNCIKEKDILNIIRFIKLLIFRWWLHRLV